MRKVWRKSTNIFSENARKRAGASVYSIRDLREYINFSFIWKKVGGNHANIEGIRQILNDVEFAEKNALNMYSRESRCWGFGK